MTKALVISGHSESRDLAWRGLIAGIVLQAVRDARGRNMPQALDAALWLASPDAETFLDALGLDVDPVVLLTSGKVRKLAKVGFCND